MGIKNLNRRLVEIGKIKIGGHGAERKGANGPYRLPVKFDHFKVTGIEKDGTDNFIPNAEIMAKLGDKPKSLDIRLLSDDIDNNFPTRYASYKSNKCFCSGDGVIASRRTTHDGNNKELPEPIYIDIKCNTETCPIFLEKKCKPNGSLSLMLPQCEKVGGVFKFRTTSWNSIINITSSLEAIKLLTGGVIDPVSGEVKGGILAGLPLTMELIEKQTEDHGKIKVVNIVYAGSIEKLQLESGYQKQLRIEGSVNMGAQDKLIKDSGLLTPEDGPDEFYPESEIEPEPEKKVKGANSETLENALKKTSSVEKPKKEGAKKDKKPEPEKESEKNVESEKSESGEKKQQLDIF